MIAVFKQTCHVVLFLPLLFAGCANLQERADAMARPAGFERREIPAGAFILTTYSRFGDATQPTTVYIEGDGLAWISEYQPSPNPTPRKALALALAANDPAANVAYVARPCQYTPFSRTPKCATPYWTDKRFSREVVVSVNKAVDALIGNKTNKDVHLVGFSGGGAIAVLVAAQREGVRSVRTVAGNLDHRVFTRLHDVSPMAGSLNARDVAASIAQIPQLHFVGQNDRIVPLAVAESYRKAAPSQCSSVEVVPDTTHEDGWQEKWPVLVVRPVLCGKK